MEELYGKHIENIPYYNNKNILLNCVMKIYCHTV